MAIRLINEDVAGDPHSGWATRGHEAERTAERIAFEFESEEDEIEKYKEDQRRVLDSGGGLADMASWAGQSAIKGSSESMRMALLTFSIIGIQ
jgi:solute carrier family 45 protein 1/2/4